MSEFKEVFESNLRIEEDEESRMSLTALVQKADFLNLNDRIYPFKVLDQAVKAFKLDRSFSQVDHPLSKASLKSTSHLIQKLWWQGKNLMAKILVLNTPGGKAIREVLKAGGRPGLSSRGQGTSKTIKMNGKDIQQIETFKFSGFDFVASPSVKATGVQKILSENQQYLSVEEEMVLSMARGLGNVKKPAIKEEEEGLSEAEREVMAMSRAIAGIVKPKEK